MAIFTSRTTLAPALLRPFAAAGWLCVALLASTQATAQQAGTDAVVSMTLPATAEPVQGWSVKHGLLGRPVYASPGGKQIGTILDLVVTSAAEPYVLVIGVGGFIELHGHAVAVPIAAVVEQDGVLVFPGATRAGLQAMPRFTYTKSTMQRAQFIRSASDQLSRANAALLLLERRATAENGSARVELEREHAMLQADITSAEDKLADLKKAEAARWVLLQKDLKRALSRVRAGTSHEKAAPAALAPGQS